MTPRNRFLAALAGTIAVALCCFTPLLVIAFAALGLGALTPYLDYVLFPALGILVIVTVLSYRRYSVGREGRDGAESSKRP